MNAHYLTIPLLKLHSLVHLLPSNSKMADAQIDKLSKELYKNQSSLNPALFGDDEDDLFRCVLVREFTVDSDVTNFSHNVCSEQNLHCSCPFLSIYLTSLIPYHLQTCSLLGTFANIN